MCGGGRCGNGEQMNSFHLSTGHSPPLPLSSLKSRARFSLGRGRPLSTDRPVVRSAYRPLPCPLFPTCLPRLPLLRPLQALIPDADEVPSTAAADAGPPGGSAGPGGPHALLRRNAGGAADPHALSRALSTAQDSTRAPSLGDSRAPSEGDSRTRTHAAHTPAHSLPPQASGQSLDEARLSAADEQV